MQLDRYNNQPISLRLHLQILGAMLNLIIVKKNNWDDIT